MKANPPTLYSYTECPFAMRARMALIYAGVQCEIREVNLKYKPQDMLTLSPKGTVPVLNLEGGRVLDESFDIMQYALEKRDRDHWLECEGATSLVVQADNYFKRAHQRHRDPEAYPEETWELEAEHLCSVLETALYKNDGVLDESHHFTLKDAAILPLVYILSTWDEKWWNDLPFPKVKIWLSQFKHSHLFSSAMESHRIWHEGVDAQWLIDN